MYTDNIDPATGQPIPNTVKRLSDGLIIEFDITKIEYQEYLLWQAEQNPMPAWAPEEPTINPMKF